jgi:hypothetical protein
MLAMRSARSMISKRIWRALVDAEEMVPDELEALKRLNI